MARRRIKRPRAKGDWRSPPARLRPARGSGRDSGGAPDLLLEVRRRLGSGEPLDLIAQVSGLIAVTDPRRVSPMERRADDPPSLPDLARSFIDIECGETSALLAVIGELAGDEELRSEIRRELDRRDDPLPEWLARLGEARAYRAVETVHALGDGENLIVGVKLAGDHELAALLYVDHNLGSVAKDGFVAPEPVAAIVMALDAVGDEDTRSNDIALADARARISQAIERGAMTFPPFESETWPICRPVVEWVARLLPEGGTGFERPEWTQKATAELARRFFASPIGRPLASRDNRDLLQSIMWYGTDYGPGDPRRWSPPAAEILLLDWIPRKIIAGGEFLAAAPGLLAAFVGFCDAERGIPARLTNETLDAIESFTPEYLRIIAGPRLQGPAALLAAVGALDPDDQDWFTGGDVDAGLRDVEDIMLDTLREAVGGDTVLTDLDDRPLPDEPFDWPAVPEDIRDRVEEVLTLCDAGCAAFFDTEFRTACRRLLVRAASGDPRVFRRKARSETAAAAIMWIIGKANHLLSRPGSPYVRELADHFGVSQQSISQRAATLLGAAGFPDRHYGDLRLGSPHYLVSVRRAQIMARRDRYAAAG